MKRMRKRTEEKKKREFGIILHLLILTGYCIDLRQQTLRVVCLKTNFSRNISKSKFVEIKI